MIERLRAFQAKYAASGGDIKKANRSSIIKLWNEIDTLATYFLGHTPNGCGACYARDFRLLLTLDANKLCRHKKC